MSPTSEERKNKKEYKTLVVVGDTFKNYFPSREEKKTTINARSRSIFGSAAAALAWREGGSGRLAVSRSSATSLRVHRFSLFESGGPSGPHARAVTRNRNSTGRIVVVAVFRRYCFTRARPDGFARAF